MAEEWINSVEKPCRCAACGTSIKQGDSALVDLESDIALCKPCGVTLQRQEQDPNYAYAFEEEEAQPVYQDAAAAVDVTTDSPFPDLSSVEKSPSVEPEAVQGAEMLRKEIATEPEVFPEPEANVEPEPIVAETSHYPEPNQESVPESAEPVEAEAAHKEESYGAAPVAVSNDGIGYSQDVWKRFFSYSASCLRSDMIDGLVGANGKNWSLAGNDCETVICQGDRLLPITPELERLLSRVKPGQSLQYGWPLVALDTRDGLKVAPLLVVDLAPPPYTGRTIQVYGEPVINPAIIRALWSNSGDVSFLHAQMSEGLPRGTANLARFSAKIGSLMGLQIVDELDALALEHAMPGGPGVYNMATAVIVESLPMAKPVIEELRQIANSKDWENTAAAFLFGQEPEPISGRVSMPLMPWSAEPAFEEALQMVRSKPLNVFEMSQRDTIDHLIVSACANAWMDNESVLVVSDDDNKLDELARLAVDVHPGLLIRTVVESDLEHNKIRAANTNTISMVASAMINEVQAAKDSIAGILEKSLSELEKESQSRSMALKGAAERAELLSQKQRLEKTRVDSAKKIWTHGLFPKGTNSREIGLRGKALQRSWLLTTLRTKMLISSIKGKPTATLKDVMSWCMADLEVKEVDNKLATEYNDLDRFNVGSANYRWADVSIRAVSATISDKIRRIVPALEDLALVTDRSMSSRRFMAAVQPVLKAWAADYRSVQEFFNLEPGLFDLVILDNTHRMNLAWALPVVFRAKRVVVIGDPRSTRSSVFLDSFQLDNMASRYEFDRETLASRCLDYADSSVFSAFSHA